jgi:hypothetical protein
MMRGGSADQGRAGARGAPMFGSNFIELGIAVAFLFVELISGNP